MGKTLQNSLRQRLQVLKQTGLYRERRSVESLPGGKCVIDGRELLNFGSNDYLGLAHDPRVCEAFATVAQRQAGSTASSLIVGRSPYHAMLEERLAAFEACDAALLYPTGFAANLGTIQALVQPDDHVFSERENHASLIDAIRGSKVPVTIYRRDCLDELRQTVESRRDSFAHGYIVTDGVFSMDGTVAPLQELCDLADRFDLAVIVDEAHGTGVLGERGCGACEISGVRQGPFVHVGTLSKAVGCLGGFAAGSQDTIDWLRNRARPQFFSTALPPAVCAAALQSLDIIETEPERRGTLRRLNQEARACARSLGLTVCGDGPAPIIPILMPENADLPAMSQQLQQEGWFVPAIRPPTVPPGTSRFRISLTVDHRSQEIQRLLERIAQFAVEPV